MLPTKKLMPLLLSSVLLAGCFNTENQKQENAIKQNELNTTLENESKKLRKNLEIHGDIISKYEKKSLENTVLDVTNVEYKNNADYINSLSGRYALLINDIPKETLKNVYTQLYPNILTSLNFYTTYLDIPKLQTLYASDIKGSTTLARQLQNSYTKDAKLYKRQLNVLKRNLKSTMEIINTEKYKKYLEKEQREKSITEALTHLPDYIEQKEKEETLQYRKDLKVYKKQLKAYEEQMLTTEEELPPPTRPKKPIKLDISKYTETELKAYAEKSISKEQLALDTLNLELQKSTEYVIGVELYISMTALLTYANTIYNKIIKENAAYGKNIYYMSGLMESYKEEYGIDIAKHHLFIELLRYKYLVSQTSEKELPIHLLNTYLPDEKYLTHKKIVTSFSKKRLYTKNQRELQKLYHYQLKKSLELQNDTELLNLFLPKSSKTLFHDYRISQASNLIEYYDLITSKFIYENEHLSFPPKKEFTLETNLTTIHETMSVLEKAYTDTLKTYKKKINYTETPQSTAVRKKSANLYIELKRSAAQSEKNSKTRFIYRKE